MPLEAVDGWMWHRMRMSVTFWVFTLQPLPVTVTRRNVSVARTHLHTLDFLLRTKRQLDPIYSSECLEMASTVCRHVAVTHSPPR